jgi:hypothetical protein
MNKYLIVIWGDLEIGLEGPYKTDKDRWTAAREHRREDFKVNDGLFKLDCEGEAKVGDFCGHEALD